MNRVAIRLAMAALLVNVVPAMANEEAAPVAAGAGTSRVEEAVAAELAAREPAPKEEWRKSMRLSAHMDRAFGLKVERYHHLDWPNPDQYHYQGKGRVNESAEAYAAARAKAEAEIAAADARGESPVWIEDVAKDHKACSGHGKRCSCNHLWANDWEREHKRYFWHVLGDIEAVGSSTVPEGIDHSVPPPRPVRWNDANHACPLPGAAFFRPPAERTIVVPFPLPREGDFRAHLSPGMNRIVDQVDWLRAVTFRNGGHAD